LESIVGWDSDVHVHHSDLNKYSTRWKAVHDLVKVFSMVRDQGRRRMFDAREAVGDVGGIAKVKVNLQRIYDQASLKFGEDE